MGHVLHHAIVVTSWDEQKIQEAHAKAVEIECTATPIIESPVNGYRSFMVAPDGSKEGWDESDNGNDRRLRFTDWLREQSDDEGSSRLEWVEISYGSDDRDANIESHQWDAENETDEAERDTNG